MFLPEATIENLATSTERRYLPSRERLPMPGTRYGKGQGEVLLANLRTSLM